VNLLLPPWVKPLIAVLLVALVFGAGYRTGANSCRAAQLSGFVKAEKAEDKRDAAAADITTGSTARGEAAQAGALEQSETVRETIRTVYVASPADPGADCGMPSGVYDALEGERRRINAAR
jgi:hypothetical protein